MRVVVRHSYDVAGQGQRQSAYDVASQGKKGKKKKNKKGKDKERTGSISNGVYDTASGAQGQSA